MNVTRRGAMLALAGLAVTGCSGGSDEEAAAPVSTEPQRQPVEEVDRLELGQTRTGIALAAYGQAPGIGYTGPRLVARRNGAPGPDGLIDFDFLLTPPDPGLNLPRGEGNARRVRVDLLLTGRDLIGARGMRVYGTSNFREITFR